MAGTLRETGVTLTSVRVAGVTVMSEVPLISPIDAEIVTLPTTSAWASVFYIEQDPADFAITRKSQARASEKPPPAATPLMAATTGFLIRRISKMAK